MDALQRQWLCTICTTWPWRLKSRLRAVRVHEMTLLLSSAQCMACVLAHNAGHVYEMTISGSHNGGLGHPAGFPPKAWDHEMH